MDGWTEGQWLGLKNGIKGGVGVGMTAIAEKFNFDFPLCTI